MTRLDSTLERLLASDYLDGLESKPLSEIRTMRSECQSAETAVSYLRRLAQGRLDIVHAFMDRQEDQGGSSDLEDLVGALPAIMGAGPPRPSGPGRLPVQLAPDMEIEDLTADVDAVLDPAKIGRLPDIAPEDLSHIADQLSLVETDISNYRRSLHERIDRLQSEIVTRYKRGEASVEGLFS